MKKLALIVVLCLMTACSSRDLQQGFSYYGVIPKEQAVSKEIADDLASYLAKQYPAGHTSFNLLKAKDENLEVTDEEKADSFTTIFENALRQKGFTISKNGIELSYIIDNLDNELGKGGYYTQLRFADGSNFSSVYDDYGKPLLTRSSLEHGADNE